MMEQETKEHCAKLARKVFNCTKSYNGCETMYALTMALTYLIGEQPDPKKTLKVVFKALDVGVEYWHPKHLKKAPKK